MSVTGNANPPYHDAGRRACEATLRQTVAKLQALAGEARKTWDAGMYLYCLAVIEERLERMTRLKLEWEGQER